MTLKFSGLIAAIFAVLLTGPVFAQAGKKGSSGPAVIDAPACGELNFTDGVMVCSCPAGASSGSVWGSGPYTSDSNICNAARHAGVVGDAGGAIQLLERPGQSSYPAGTANGVTTSSWGSYGSSFAVAAVGSGTTTTSTETKVVCSTIPDGTDTWECSCPAGKSGGSVWGNGPYTADSDICSAAIHNGYIDADGGDIYILRVRGLSSYLGEDHNDVSSSNWNAYDSSIIFDWNK